MKIGVIGGAGLLGSTIAFCISQRNLVDEIVLIDLKENVAKAHVMDMGQAISEHNHTAISFGSWDSLKGCNIVIMTASMPERKVASRIEYLTDNLYIVSTVAANIANYCPRAAVINATNPVDPVDFIIHDLTGMPAQQFVGFTRNDTLRLRWAIAKVLHVPTTEVEAMVIGEHGESQVPLYSTVRVRGQKVELSTDQKEDSSRLIKDWFTNYQELQSGRTSGWTSALGVTHLVEAMVKKTGEILACSAILHGEFGISDVSVGVPVILGPNGIEQIVEMPLTPEESLGLKAAAEKMRGILGSVTWHQ